MKKKPIGEIKYYTTKVVDIHGTLAVLEFAIFRNGAEKCIGQIGGRIEEGPGHYRIGPKPEAVIRLPCGTFEFWPTPWGRMAILEEARQDRLRDKSNNRRRREGLPMLRRIKRRKKR